ncbi:MAG: D-glycerate dehydrogenase [Terricaulis sp.]
MTPSTMLLVTRRWPQAAERYLAERHHATLNIDDVPLTQAALAAALRVYDVILPTITDRIDADLLAQPLIRTKLLCNYGAGVNHIDLEACRRAGVAVSNTPDILTESTAELAIALMLAVARRLGEGERELRAGRWTGWRPSHLQGRRVTGRTFGVVGFGRIGRETARMAHYGFKMPILYHARQRAPAEVEAALGGADFRPILEDLLSEADFVSLHTPGGDATSGLIAAAQLGRMKPSGVLINTARGGVVDESALIAALQTGVIAGAGLDVYAAEPAVPATLRALENVVLAPHLGSATFETREAMGMRAIENLELFLGGNPLRDPV